MGDKVVENPAAAAAVFLLSAKNRRGGGCSTPQQGRRLRDRRYIKAIRRFNGSVITDRSSVILKHKISRLRRSSIILPVSCELRLAIKCDISLGKEKQEQLSIRFDRFYRFCNLKMQISHLRRISIVTNLM